MIAVEFAALGNFNPGQRDSKTLCSSHICRRGTLATVFLDSLLGKLSQEAFRSTPFLPLPTPVKARANSYWLPHSPLRPARKQRCYQQKPNDTTQGKQEMSQTPISRPSKALGEIPGTFCKSSLKELLSKN